jgi:Mg2+/Co2+ transporter CorB
LSDLPLGVLFGALIIFLLLSAFFSGSETGMMALNRYRLRHLVKNQHKGATRAAELLERPDRLIGLILFGNNFINIVASMLAAFIAWRIMGEPGLALAPFVLTVVILVFAEVAPKTLAALHPERVAFPAAIVLKPLLTIFYPIVAAINWLANGVLRLLRILPDEVDPQQLSTDELRTVVNEAGTLISQKYQSMLVSILDLEKVTVDDIMVPRNEISGIDIEDDMDEIVELLVHSQHTRLPLYRGDVDDVLGVLHLRKILQPLEHRELDKDWLLENASEPYFVPLGTPLNTQLRNFQRQRQRIGLVVDEYGDVDGLVTLEDLLEEIVGEFTTDPADQSPDVHPQDDGTFLIDGGANVRELNRSQGWELPTDGPKTLNGLVLEYLESIPEPGTSLLIARYPVEIVQVSGNAVKTARVKPAMRRPLPPPVDDDS